MESEKHKTNGDDRSPEKRSYHCNFCKRGFTNAQALGGHMNIHRKDKAKAKKKNKINQQGPSIIQNLSCYDDPQISSTIYYQQYQTRYYTPLVKYQAYLPYSSNPSFQTGNNNYPGDHMNVNLSLRIDDGARESEVDLELRLGPV